jgi:hypothetical protein
VTDPQRTRTRLGFATATLIAGVIDIAVNPASINPDGVAYIEVGRAILAGQRQGIVGYWSPLYSTIVAAVLGLFHATPATEVLIARSVNVVFFLIAALAFESLVTAWLTRLRASGAIANELLWRIPAYAVFLWTCVRNIGIAEITPDLGVAAAIFAATAMLLNDAPGTPARRAAWLGVVLGIGYLDKAVLFVVAFPILAVYAWRSGARPAAVAFGVFLLVSAPWIAVLSSVKGRPTFGDVGRLNVVWYNTNIRAYQHWQGDEPGLGTPRHPTRRLRRNPEVFEFATPFRVSYAPWYDASYWYEGVVNDVPVTTMIARANRSVRGTSKHLWPLAVGVLLLLAVTPAIPRPSLGTLRDVAPFAVPALFTYAIYASIALYTRYVSAAAALLYLGTFLAWTLKADDARRRRIAMAWCVVGVLVTGHLGREWQLRARESMAGGGLHWRDDEDVAVAQQLMARYPTGTQVAGIGSTGSWMYWPHFAGFRMVAESPNYDDVHFWAARDSARADALCLLQRSGAVFVVSDSLPTTTGPEWTPLAGGRYALRTLTGACPPATPPTR